MHVESTGVWAEHFSLQRRCSFGRGWLSDRHVDVPVLLNAIICVNVLLNARSFLGGPAECRETEGCAEGEHLFGQHMRRGQPGKAPGSIPRSGLGHHRHLRRSAVGLVVHSGGAGPPCSPALLPFRTARGRLSTTCVMPLRTSRGRLSTSYVVPLCTPLRSVWTVSTLFQIRLHY